MKSASRSSWFVLSGLVASVLLLGVFLPGCEPEPEKKPEKKSGESVKQTPEPKKAETPAKPEVKTEEPKHEVMPEEPKAEPKKEEPKPEVKPEVKPEEPKAEPKKEEPKPEAKPEVKPEEPKTEPKKEEPKAEPKKEEPKPEVKPEPKKEEPKPEAKKEEPKAEPKKEEPKKDEPAKKAEPAVMPAAPKISTFAPADDLAAQLAKYVADLAKVTATEEEYKEIPDEKKIARDSNTAALLALALGMHDQENKYKANAGAIIAAAQKLAATKTFASAKTAGQDLKAAADGKGSSEGELKWTKLSSLEQLMKDQVPSVNTKLTNNLKKFSKKSKDIAGLSAILAVIAQDAMLYVSDTKKPEEAKKWFDFSVQMRDAAAAVNAQTHANDEKAATAAGEKLNQSCHDCHAVFHEEKNEKTEK